MRKKISCIIVSIVLVCSAFDIGFSKNFFEIMGINSTVYAESQADRIVDIAKSQIGKGGRPNDYTRWFGTIGGSYSYHWCHAFVSWCAKEAGALGNVPRTASCVNGMNWFKDRNRWKDRGYTPSKGDIIYFKNSRNSNDSNHVGIVDYSSNGRVYTIEGNCSDQVKYNGGYSNGYAINDSKIVGYGIPEYNTIVGPTDKESPIVTEGNIIGVNDQGYMIECSVKDNVEVNSVKVATWTSSNGQDDLKWVDMVKWDNGKYRLFIYYSDHGNDKDGVYYNDVYAWDASGNQAVGKRVMHNDKEGPVMSEPVVLADNEGGYMLSCAVSDNYGIDRVVAATWTEKDDQDDLKWVDMVQWDDGTYRLYINFSDHGNVKNDTYINHIYVYDNGGNHAVKEVRYKYDADPPVITNARVTNITKDGYTVSCNVSDNKGVASVNLATWTANVNNGSDQDDIIWKETKGGASGQEYTWEVKFSEHNNEKDVKYWNHIWAYDTGGTGRVEECNVFIADEIDHLDKFEYDSEKNELRMKGWAIAKDEIQEVVYVIDDRSEVKFNQYSRSDVAQAYPGYPTGNEGFDFTIDGNELISGEHTVQIIVRTKGGYEHNLGSISFTSRSDIVPKKTIVRNGVLYSIYDKQATWTESCNLASQMNSSLVKVDSDQKKKIINELMEYGAKSSYWLGARRTGEDSWEWTDGTSVTYSNWADGEPSNWHNVENYCYTYSHGEWNDAENIGNNTGFITETNVTAAPKVTAYSNGHYYYLYEQNINWHEAKAYCEYLGGHLVTISDAAEQNVVDNLVKQGTSDEYEAYLIGLENKTTGEWRWVTDEKLDYTNWNSGEPNNFGGIEHYGEITVSSGKWNDVRSYRDASKQGFICEIDEDNTYTTKEQFGQNEYWRIDKALSWEDAKQYCENIGGHLAVITSAEENAAAAKLLKRATENVRPWYYIGAENSSSGQWQWQWVDGSSVSYENWESGEPNNVGGTEHYMTMTSAKGTWNDSNNIFNMGGLSNPAFICEFENAVETPTPNPTETPEPTEKPTDTPSMTEAPTKEPDPSAIQINVGTVKGKAGETVTLPVRIDNNIGLFSAAMELVYDSEKLTPIAVSTGEVFEGGALQTDFENGTKILWTNNAMKDITDTGTMLEVSFIVNEGITDEAIPVTINEETLDICNFNEESCKCEITGGSIEISKMMLHGGRVTGTIGKSVEVPVTISENDGINSFSITTKFNNTILTPERLEAGTLVKDKGAITSNIDDENTDWSSTDYITALWTADNIEEDIVGDGELYSITFTINENAEEGESPIEFVEYEAANAAGNSVNLGAENGSINLEVKKYIYGDVNSDAKINVLDVVDMKKFILNPETSGVDETEQLAADVNVDGRVDMKDLTRLRKYVAKYKGVALGQ